MYKIIMAAHDGSSNSSIALTRAIRFARHFKAELRIVRVSEPVIVVDALAGVASAESQQKAIDAQVARELRELEACARKARRVGIPSVVTALLEGSPAITLANYAREFQIDLIVMSSHSRGEVARLALGSVTDYLSRNTEIPVLIVRQAPNLVTRDEAIVERILVPLDGSELAEQILPQVVALTSTPFTTVNLLQVLTPATFSQKKIMEPALPWWENEFSRADDYLEHTAGFLRHSGIAVVTDVVLSADIGGAILQHAADARADLIALTTSGTGGWKRLLFGSIADEIARKSRISVLLFHPKSAAADAQASFVDDAHAYAVS